MLLLLGVVFQALLVSLVQAKLGHVPAGGWCRVMLRNMLLLPALAFPWAVNFVAVLFFLDEATIKADTSAGIDIYELAPAIPRGSLEPGMSAAVSSASLIAICAVPLLIILLLLEASCSSLHCISIALRRDRSAVLASSPMASIRQFLVDAVIGLRATSSWNKKLHSTLLLGLLRVLGC